MTLPQGFRLIGFSLLSLVTASVMTLTVHAQEISDAHLSKARAAITALGTTDNFDNIIPSAARELKATLIQASPNLQNEIIATVDETALTLAGRRGDLEREAARIYAETFSEEELEAIAEFYTSPAGLKLLSEGVLVTRGLLQAADIWASGISRDLATATNDALRQRVGDAGNTGNSVDTGNNAIGGAASPVPDSPSQPAVGNQPLVLPGNSVTE